MKKIRQDIIEALLGAKRVLVTAHKNPDGDSLGSQLGVSGFLASRDIDHLVANEGEIPGKYGFMPGIDRVHIIDRMTPEEIKAASEKKFDTAIILECSNLDRIGDVRQLLDDDCTIINVDHHPDNVPFGAINWKDPRASAAGEMIYDLLTGASLAIDGDMATNLYTAILTDTGRFHYNNTTPHSLRVAADLVELGADPVGITEEVYFNERVQHLRLTGMVLSGMQLHLDDRICLLTVDRAMMRKAKAGNGDTEGLVNNSLRVEGVQVGVLFTELDEETTKVSFRSQGDFDVAEVAAVYGGGGHYNASGCILEMPLEKARAAISENLKDRLNNGSL